MNINNAGRGFLTFTLILSQLQLKDILVQFSKRYNHDLDNFLRELILQI